MAGRGKFVVVIGSDSGAGVACARLPGIAAG
jgi:hypothetical protein